MKTVGLTGGIGSGKTTVACIFEQFDIPVYYADAVSKELAESNPNVVSEIVKLFGAEIYKESKLLRKQVAQMVFNDSGLLEKLNGIIHPVVEDHFRMWLTLHQNAPFVLKEAAILIESGGDKKLDQLVLVTAPEHIRVERVVRRDGVSEDQVRARMAHQWLDSEKVKRANFVIHCDEQTLVLPQVLNIYQSLI